MNDPDTKRGLYRKYFVQRLEPKDSCMDLTLVREGARGVPIALSPPKKHAECRYYVLDLDHDRFAAPALLAYADACAAEYPALAADLRKLAAPVPGTPGPTDASAPGKDDGGER